MEQRHKLSTLSQEKEPTIPTGNEASGLQNRSGHGGKEKNPCSYQELNSAHPTLSQSLHWHKTYFKHITLHHTETWIFK
jgi:hypothetical protein